MRWKLKQRELVRPWFAWHPVLLESKEGVWLETVWRAWIAAADSGFYIYGSSKKELEDSCPFFLKPKRKRKSRL